MMRISDQLLEAIRDRAVLDAIVQTGEATGSLEDAIKKMERYGDQKLFLPGGKRPRASELAREMKRWRPKYVRGDTTVYHSTSRDAAEFMLRNGVIPQLKPWTMAARRYASGDYAEFRPGAGVERGLYVGTSKSTSGFGPVTLAINVPSKWLEVPAELTSLGHRDPSKALETEHGAIIRRPVHPRAIKRA